MIPTHYFEIALNSLKFDCTCRSCSRGRTNWRSCSTLKKTVKVWIGCRVYRPIEKFSLFNERVASEFAFIPLIRILVTEILHNSMLSFWFDCPQNSRWFRLDSSELTPSMVTLNSIMRDKFDDKQQILLFDEWFLCESNWLIEVLKREKQSASESTLGVWS